MQGVAIQTDIDVESIRQRSFTDLLAPLVDPAFRLACAMLHDPQSAEDAVQEASIIAWGKFTKLDDSTRVRSWFLGIVANECRNARRHGWRLRVQIGLPAALSSESNEDRSVRGADLRRALLQLAHQDRLVVVLYYYFDMPLDEIATVAHITLAAARNRLYRTVRRLRPHIALEEALQ